MVNYHFTKCSMRISHMHNVNAMIILHSHQHFNRHCLSALLLGLFFFWPNYLSDRRVVHTIHYELLLEGCHMRSWRGFWEGIVTTRHGLRGVKSDVEGELCCDTYRIAMIQWTALLNIVGKRTYHNRSPFQTEEIGNFRSHRKITLVTVILS